jgi:hypothetical protein
LTAEYCIILFKNNIALFCLCLSDTIYFNPSIGLMLPWIQQFMKINKKAVSNVFVFGILFFVALFCATPVFAQDTLGVQQVGNNLALGGGDIRIIIAKIIRAALGLIGIVLFVQVVRAGALIMMSGGNEEKVLEGKRMLTNAVIGLIIIMSSVSIVQFILMQLERATGAGGFDDGTGRRPPIESFIFGGALGQTVSDHYPFRKQTEVKRNTKIVVTFFPAIDPGSIIENTNNTCVGAGGVATSEGCELDAEGKILQPYFGDCIFPAGVAFDQQVHCDHLKKNAVKIFVSPDQQDGQELDPDAPEPELLDALAFTTYEDGVERNARTFVFQSTDSLGSDEDDVWYTVELTGEILKKSNAEVPLLDVPYIWEFQTDTEFDYNPPHVISVFPARAREAFRNSIIKITFDEPIDPTVVQGLSGTEPDTSFNNIIFDDPIGGVDIRGEWKISNGYRTVEFVSEDACGLNSCGEPMYCLPVQCDDAADIDCVAPYEILIRTAVRARQDLIHSFESIPFSGVMDMSGNALDGNADGNPDGKPTVGNPKIITPADENTSGERVPDNYVWNFSVKNDIDREPPYIEDVLPRLDEEDVIGDAEVKLIFNKIMWSRTLSGVSLVEYPVVAPFWSVPRSEDGENKTELRVLHREFGPNDKDVYYFSAVSSTVRSATQNCLYPGRGPLYNAIPPNGITPACSVDADGNAQDCVGVDGGDSDNDTGCLQRARLQGDVLATATVDDCIEFLQTEEISPTDRDRDGIDDIDDNCPDDPNPNHTEEDECE